MASSVVSTFSSFYGTFSAHHYLDDVTDRANRIYAPVLLMVSASLLGLIQFFGDPIECTKVDQDAYAEMDYVKTYCWAHGTYDIHDDRHLSYYQWVPVVLALQAFFFQMPFLFWAQRSRASGLNLPTLMKGAFALTEVHKDAGERKGICAEVAVIMDAYFRRNLMFPVKSLKRKTTANLTLCYFLSKVFYLLNITIQVYLLNEFLDEKFFENFNAVALRMIKRSYFEESRLFPILAKCKFYNNMDDLKKGGGGTKEHLCTLPLNLYNDRLFFSVAALLLCMMIGMLWSTGQWMIMLFLPSFKDSLIRKVLKEDVNHHHLHRRSKGGYDFVDDYLRTDGVLVLKLIRLNMGVHVSRELVIALFPLFIESAKRTSEAKRVSIDVGYEFDSPTTTTTTSNEMFLPLTNDGDGHQNTSPV